MNIFVSKTGSIPIPVLQHKPTKTLSQVKDELAQLSQSDQLKIKGGRILRIKPIRKYCRNLTPQ